MREWSGLETTLSKQKEINKSSNASFTYTAGNFRPQLLYTLALHDPYKDWNVRDAG